MHSNKQSLHRYKDQAAHIPSVLQHKPAQRNATVMFEEQFAKQLLLVMHRI